MQEMLDLLQSADDSDGTIGGIIEESLESIRDITQSYRLPQTEVEELLQLLLEESAHSRLEGWSDWQHVRFFINKRGYKAFIDYWKHDAL